MSRWILASTLSALLLLWALGCSLYDGVVRPVDQLNALSPELQSLTDASIETYLKSNVKVNYPTVVAVARLEDRSYGDPWRTGYLGGAAADGWQDLKSLRDSAGKPMINQVQFISPMLSGRNPTLKSLRDAAALLHAPVLIAYVQMDDAKEGQNSAAMAYWSIVGLFTVPGNTVGRYSLCHALLIDTQSGVILATVQGEAKQEENVLPGAVEIARERLEAAVPAQAVADLQKNVKELMVTLAQSSEGGAATGQAQ